MKRIALCLIGLLSLTLVHGVNAGGGLNAILSPEKTVGFTGEEGIKIIATVYNYAAPAPHDKGVIVGKEYVFDIEDSDSSKGQACQTIQPVSDTGGKVEGRCVSTKAGFLKVYVREVGSAQRTSSATLKFVYPISQNPSMQTGTPMPSSSISQEPKPTTMVSPHADPEAKKRIEDLENQVKTLTTNVNTQKQEINAIQQLLQKIISFFEKVLFAK